MSIYLKFGYSIMTSTVILPKQCMHITCTALSQTLTPYSSDQDLIQSVTRHSRSIVQGMLSPQKVNHHVVLCYTGMLLVLQRHQAAWQAVPWPPNWKLCPVSVHLHCEVIVAHQLTQHCCQLSIRQLCSHAIVLTHTKRHLV